MPPLEIYAQHTVYPANPVLPPPLYSTQSQTPEAEMSFVGKYYVFICNVLEIVSFKALENRSGNCKDVIDIMLQTHQKHSEY
jgi:hypothetical protein